MRAVILFLIPSSWMFSRYPQVEFPLLPRLTADLNVESPATGVEGSQTELPLSTELGQNYPNPFNPTTNIGLRIVDFGLVSLKVFDVLGREVATLVNEVRSPGTYTVRWDGSGQPSGVYFYRLQAQGFVETKRMILVK